MLFLLFVPSLLADVEFLDDGPVTLNVRVFQVIEEAFAFAYQVHQRTLRVLVFRALFHVAGQEVNALCKQGNLGF